MLVAVVSLRIGRVHHFVSVVDSVFHFGVVRGGFGMRELGDVVPVGYSETIDCMNKPQSWDVPGMIADMAECLRLGNEVPAGQLLAALDWMTFRLRECRSVLVAADSELSAISHGRLVDKAESQRISDDARKLCEVLRGFKSR